MRKLIWLLLIFAACETAKGYKPRRLGALASGPLGAPSNAIIWPGTSYVALLDAGVQKSTWMPVENSNVVSVICTTQDAGAAPAFGSATLLGSNDGTNSIVIEAAATLPAITGSMGWDPVTTGSAYVAVQLDAGVASGYVSCTLQGKGPVAASN